MRKSLVAFISALFCLSYLVLPISAAGTNAPEVLVSTERIELADGYIIEEITEIDSFSPLRTTATKSGTKTSTRYTESGTAIFAVKVTGTFSYTGSASWATSSTATVYTYISGATYVSKSSNYSGNTATATGTVKYLGFNLTRTVNLSCSAGGVLS